MLVEPFPYDKGRLREMAQQPKTGQVFFIAELDGEPGIGVGINVSGFALSTDR